MQHSIETLPTQAPLDLSKIQINNSFLFARHSFLVIDPDGAERDGWQHDLVSLENSRKIVVSMLCRQQPFGGGYRIHLRLSRFSFLPAKCRIGHLQPISLLA